MLMCRLKIRHMQGSFAEGALTSIDFVNHWGMQCSLMLKHMLLCQDERYDAAAESTFFDLFSAPRQQVHQKSPDQQWQAANLW